MDRKIKDFDIDRDNIISDFSNNEKDKLKIYENNDENITANKDICNYKFKDFINDYIKR